MRRRFVSSTFCHWHFRMRELFLLVCLMYAPLSIRGETVKHVTRDYFGDIFSLEGCAPGSCATNDRRAAEIPGEKCRCQCAPSHYTFREDGRQCIKDVGECPVAMFVRPFAVERIPLVFLPMTGQLVYPGAHLTVSGIARLAPSKHLSCNVKASLLMTANGWQPIRTASQIFGVYYDGNKTFLQWLGDDEDRRGLQHHLVLIRLQCEGETNNGTFQPCAALRIGWAPGLEVETGEEMTSKNNFIIIGLCLGILGLIYVGAVLIYLKVRKNRRQASRQASSPQNMIESIEESCEESGVNHSSVTENGMKTLDILPRQLGISDAPEGKNTKSTNSKSNDARTPPRSSVVTEDANSPQEFFVRIRGMIAAAKNRLNTFRYRPTLLDIPEDDYFYQDFKERDIEASGNQKSAFKKFSKKGNSAVLNKMESIQGSNLGAAMLEAKLSPPLPPPRNSKPKNKKRAPSPPGGKNLLPEYTRETPSPVSISELTGSLDCKKSQQMLPGNGDNYSKFDLFRLDLYEKIYRMREGDTLEKDVVLEYLDSNNPNKGDAFDADSSNVHHAEGRQNENISMNAQYSSIHHDNKISRRQLLCKLEESELKIVSDADRDIINEEHGELPKENGDCGCEEDDDDDDNSELTNTGSEKTEAQELTYSSRPASAVSNSSARTTISQPTTLKENKPVLKENLETGRLRDEGSECSDTSLSGDSLNSSFRKSDKPPSVLKIQKSLRSTEDLSVISGSSVITSSTAIKEIHDSDDDVDDDAIQEDDDSRLSTDLDGEMYSLDESEHPSLEEYLQLSSQVAKKLSERTVPAFNNECTKEKNVISQFVKEFKTTIGKLKPEDGRPRSSRNTSPGSDNWTLKREEKKAKVARRVSIFKRNPLKGRKNEELLVTEESDKSGLDDSHTTIETDDAESSRSSSASSVNGKKARQRYKVKTPEIVPATKFLDGEEKRVISITNEPKQNRTIEIRQNTRYTPPPGMPRVGKTVSPPPPPPKPHIYPVKLNSLKARKNNKERAEICKNANQVLKGTGENGTMNLLKNTLNQRNGKETPHYIRTPSIESDTLSIANSDMTEDSLNTHIRGGESEIENNEEMSEDENGPIDRCLAQLADSVIQPTDDCSLNRYLSQLGTVLAAREEFPVDQSLANKLANNMNGNRATKGFNLSLHLPLCTWEHVCVDKSSDRSTPPSDRSSITSRGSDGSQENLRKKTLNKSKHHHRPHRGLECKHGDTQTNNSLENLNHIQSIYNDPNEKNAFLNWLMLERRSPRHLLNSRPHIASTSEEEESGRASSLGSTRELERPMSETTSDPGSADLERPRKKRPVLRKSKKALNGTCRQQIQNSKLNKKENGCLKSVRNISTPHSSASDVTVIQLEGDEHITNVESSNTFVTLINVDSSDCSNSAEEK